MPITLGCPSCGKRFRAREESSGKKVKCPFCQAAVSVPTHDEAAGAPAEAAPSGHASAGTLNFASPPPPPASPVHAASPGAWGAGPTAAPAHVSEPIPFLPPPPPLPPLAPTGSVPPRKKTAEEQNTAAWKRCRSGLGTVQIGLFWFALLGFVPLGKFVYERSVGPLPTGESAEWFKIDQVLNTPGENAIQLDKSDVIDLGLYGIPILFGGLALTFGRVTAGAAPRSSGAKGLFVLSGLITLIALAGFLTHVVCKRVGFTEVSGYGLWAVKIGGALGELWFLLALAAAGATLKRPAAVRSVGFFTFVVGIGAALSLFGWDLLLAKVGPEIGRPKRPEPGSDWVLYEHSAVLLGWLILIGTAWRAVGGVRRAINDYANE
jgi:hypothetical protein